MSPSIAAIATWLTPQEIDEWKLKRDFKRLDRGETVPHWTCILAIAPSYCGSQTMPMRPEEGFHERQD